jgi:hypothetical protein
MSLREESEPMARLHAGPPVVSGNQRSQQFIPCGGKVKTLSGRGFHPGQGPGVLLPPARPMC